jgi:hypothetical protein
LSLRKGLPVDVYEFFADWPESMELAVELRALVFSTIPSLQEKVQSGWCILSLRAGPRHGDTVCWIAPKTWGLHLGFPFGKEVPDPAGLMFALSGNASPARNVRVESSEDIARPALQELIRSAYALL